jgi:branched-chain amino acid transport system permease protein
MIQKLQTWLTKNRPAAITVAILLAVLLALFARFEPRVAVSILLSGLTLGAIYFLVSSGLSLIFGLMDVLNFAHGVLFMAGAYIGYAFYASGFGQSLDSNLRFGVAILVGGASGALLGAIMEFALIRPLYQRPIYQVLLTLGLTFVGTEIIKAIWGTVGYFMETPKFFNTNSPNCPSPSLFDFLRDNCSSILILGRPFPSYRLFVILFGVLAFVGMITLLQKTRIGIVIRAGVQDAEMVQALGVNVRRVFTGVFALGTGLAGMGGVIAAPIIGVNLVMGQEFLLQGFISVVIGGMGSLVGATAGALLLGLARAIGDQLVLSGLQLPWMMQALSLSPSIARASTVLIMALVLLLRPAGLFGKMD